MTAVFLSINAKHYNVMKATIAFQEHRSSTLRLGRVAKRVINLISRVALPAAVLSCVATLVFAVMGKEVSAAIAGAVCLMAAMASMEKGGEA